MNMTFGHNEAAVRLASLAGDAQIALDKVARGEADAIDGWLAYGAALNEGRALFVGDTEFGKWVADNSLRQVGGADIHDHERAAAMWAAAHRDQFDEARKAGKARTVRGIHAQWKQIEAEREAERLEQERKAEQERKRIEADAARAEAKALALAEDEARKAAAAAKTDEDRKRAELTVAKVTHDKIEAEKAVEAVEAEIASLEPEPAEAPEILAMRRQFRALTPEAQEDDFIGLREALAKAKATIEAQKEEIADLKSRLSEALSGDLGRALGNAQRRASAAEGRMREYQAIAVRADRKSKIVEAECENLRKELFNQIIPMS